MKIYNLPEWAWERRFIVFRLVEGDAWFFDAWDAYEKALKQAVEIGGQVIPVGEVAR